MNLLPKFLLIINLFQLDSISGINQDFSSKFIVNAKRNADKLSEKTSSKISKLRLILLGDVNNQNEIVRMWRKKKFCNELVDDFKTIAETKTRSMKEIRENVQGVENSWEMC